MYELNETFIRRLSDGACIPKAEGNRDYQEYLNWVAEGNSPELPPVPVPVIPQVVSAFQARAALMQAGLLSSVEAYMARPETEPIVKLAWDKAQEFNRQSPTVLSLQPVLGVTDEQLDDLFILAASITA